MEWESKLLRTPTDQWAVDRVVIFDWYDGPRQGLCALAHPAVEFAFELVGEEHNPDGLDMRVFGLRELPAGTVHQLDETPRGAPSSLSAEAIDRLQALSRESDLLISSCDMKTFTDCWRIGTPRSQGLPPGEPLASSCEAAQNLS